MKLDTLLGIPEAARIAHVPISTMRRRLKRLDRSRIAAGQSPVLVRGFGRSIKVRAEALQAALHTDDQIMDMIAKVDDRVSALESTSADTERRVVSLRQSVVDGKKQQAARWRLQQRVNKALSAITENLTALDGLINRDD